MRKRIKEWWSAESKTFTLLCATEKGETFTHGQVVLMNLAGVGLILACVIAEWLEGGASW